MHHVFVKPGDALHELQAVVDALKARGIGRDEAGLYKGMYVTRADQTVVMTESRTSPVAGELRGRAGWSEPGDAPVGD